MYWVCKKNGETIQGRTLFKGGYYLIKEMRYLYIFVGVQSLIEIYLPYRCEFPSSIFDIPRYLKLILDFCSYRFDWGKLGSFTPVMGFFSRKGALAAKAGLGLSSSSWKPIQSQWWARLALFLFQYSRNVTAETDYQSYVIKSLP